MGARFAGVSLRKTVSRAFSSLDQLGIIEVKLRTITILSMERLLEYKA